MASRIEVVLLPEEFARDDKFPYDVDEFAAALSAL